MGIKDFNIKYLVYVIFLIFSLIHLYKPWYKEIIDAIKKEIDNNN